MPSIEEERNIRATAVSNAAASLKLLLGQLRLRVGLRRNLQLEPPADTVLKRLEHVKQQLDLLVQYMPHSHEATRIVANGFQVALSTFDWLDQAVLTREDEKPASHKIAEHPEPAEPAGILMEESSPNHEMDPRERVRREVMRIQQNLAGSGHSENVHVDPAEHIKRPPNSKPDKPGEPSSHDPETPR